MTEFVWMASAFEANEYVVTVRPDWEKEWRSIPVGNTMSSKDVEVVVRWLQSSCKDLRQLFYNEFKDAE